MQFPPSTWTSTWTQKATTIKQTMHLKFPENATIIYRLRSTLVMYISSRRSCFNTIAQLLLHCILVYYWYISATSGIQLLLAYYSYYWHSTASTDVLLLLLVYGCCYCHTTATTNFTATTESVELTTQMFPIMTQMKSHFVFSIFSPSISFNLFSFRLQ